MVSLGICVHQLCINLTGIIVLQLGDAANNLTPLGVDGQQESEVWQILVVTKW